MDKCQTVICTEHLSKQYHDKKQRNEALTDLTFTVRAREIVGLVGASGSGKSTLLKLLAGFEMPTAGTIWLMGKEYQGTNRTIAAAKHIQMIFQDAAGSFNPGRTLAASLEAHMRVLRPMEGKEARRQEIRRLLEQVGVDPALAARRPGAVSGGECQRIAIARALSVQPDILLCDEITSALDVLTQEQVLQVLRELQTVTGVTILFVTHDLALAGSFCSRILVLQEGICVEQGDAAQVFAHPCHEYTRRLLNYVLDPAVCLKERMEQLERV